MDVIIIRTKERTVADMKNYVPLDKRSKKAQKAFYSKQRLTWGEVNPVTRSIPNGKAYNRKKEKQRSGREFKNEYPAGFFCAW